MMATFQPSSTSAKPAPPRGRPLYSISGLRPLLLRNEDEIRHLIRTGKLAFAFEIGVGRRRKTVRVLGYCVDCFLVGRDCALQWRDVARILTPHDGPLLSTTEVARLLSVAGDTVLNLLRSGALEAVGTYRRGWSGAARISATSFIKFMQARRWPPPPSAETQGPQGSKPKS